jgi:enterochelin esterase-like enzyme
MRTSAMLVGLTVLMYADSSELPFRTGVNSPRIEKLAQGAANGDSGAVAEFWTEIEIHGTPLIEHMTGDPTNVLLTFVYRSSTARSVQLAAQLTTLRDDPSMVLTRLASSDVWYKTFSVRNDLRLSYGLSPMPSDDAQGKDPLNPRSVRGQAIGPSFVTLENAPPQRAISPQSRIATGRVVEEHIESKILKTERTIGVYTPASYDPRRADPYPVLICFDGPTYLREIPTPTILDNLIAAGEIPPTIAIFVAQQPQPQRNVELSNNAPFADFVAQELLSHVRVKWRITSNPAQTIACGSSAGGLASAYLAFRRPDVVGKVLAQSAALWPGKDRDDAEHEWLVRQYQASPKLPITFVLQPGVLEVVPTPLNGPSILNSNRHLRDTLRAKGYDVDYSEIAGGHEPLTWRGGIAPGLIRLLGQKG